MYSLITARVIDQTLTITNIPKIASGGENEIRVDVSFCEMWDGLGKTAVFYHKESQVYSVVMKNDSCVIPREVLAEPGNLHFGIHGVGGTTVKTTEEVVLKVDKGAITGLNPLEPLPGVYKQVMSAYGSLANEVAAERARIDNIAKLPQGSTTGDAELADIRVGHDGKTYDNAGTAVREQVAAVSNAVRNSRTQYPVGLVVINGFYVQDTGRVFENASYSYSEPVTLPGGYTVSFAARGYKTQVAMISAVNEDGTYTPLVNSVDSTDRVYTYTTTKETALVFSWSTSRGYTLTALADVPSVVDALRKEINAQTPVADAERNYVSLAVFPKFGVVGDSYASGEIYYDSKFHDRYELSWGQIMARKLGTNCVNFSAGGMSTKGWLNNSHGLPLLLATEAQDIYYLALGINDANNYGEAYLGTVADINELPDLNPDTFFGNYGKIISNIKAHAPHASIVMMTMLPTTPTKAVFNAAIQEIAKHYGIPCIVQTDDPFFTSDFYTDSKVQGHPVAVVYSGMAEAIERLMKKCVVDNYDYFKTAFMY